MLTVNKFKSAVKAGDRIGAEKSLRSMKLNICRPIKSKQFESEQIYAIHYAARFGCSETLSAVLNTCPELIDQLTSTGRCAVHIAVYFGKSENITELINHSANINIKEDQHGYTPLHLAVVRRNCGAVKRLFEGDPDLNIIDKTGLSPLDLARKGGCQQIIKLLERSIHEEQINHETAEQMSALRDEVQEIKNNMDQKIFNAVQSAIKGSLMQVPPPVPPRKNVPPPKVAKSMINLQTAASVPSLNMGSRYPSGWNLTFKIAGGQMDNAASYQHKRISSGYNSSADICPDLQASSEHRNSLKTYFPYLVENIRCKDILALLFARRIVREYDMDKLSSEHMCEIDKMTYLLNQIILKGPPSVFEQFIEILEEAKYGYIASMLRKPEAQYTSNYTKLDGAKGGRCDDDGSDRTMSTQSSITDKAPLVDFDCFDIKTENS